MLYQDTAKAFYAISPAATPLPNGTCQAIYVGGAGSVVVTPDPNTPNVTPVAVTFAAVPAGTVLKVSAAIVGAASTATNMVALY